MEIGFLTACLPQLSLEEIVPWAAEQGFQALEISAWPPDNTRDYSGVHLDVENLSSAKADEIGQLFDDHGMSISCLTYCENHLDPKKGPEYSEHLRKVINAADLLGVATVSNFVGRNPDFPLEENLNLVEQVFAPLLDHAGKKDVRLAIENCPMPGWQFEGLVGNIAFSPEWWDALFDRLPQDNFGLNLDPSHLYWLGVDYLDAVPVYADRIFHVHAKDAEILEDELAYRGLGTWHGWWRYRMPGWGEIAWGPFISTLIEYGYNDVISIEHEDPIWEGSEAKVKEGLTLGQRYLSQFVI
jgi:sugar phosphate isomerase/epimerase